MNPEFIRNVWLELTPRRMTIMAVLLILAFLASEGSPGLMSSGSIAQNLFYLIVVLWGTRNAALSVVGEIRDRTWDSQRLSSIGPGAMTVGKLFGGTIYNWFGGAICLIMILAQSADGFAHGLMECIRLIGMGALAQAASLLASLIAIRRRQSAHSRLDIFVYQIAGLVAAGVFQLVWGEATVARMSSSNANLNIISWWGADYAGPAFALVSLAIFAAWTFVGCYRQMRTELQMSNGPIVWLLFSLFLAIYAAGFASLGSKYEMYGDLTSLRVALFAGTLGALTYITMLLEPKDRVLYRWMRAQLGAGHIGAVLWRIQTWMMDYVLFVVASAFLLLLVVGNRGDFGPALVLAGAGFVTRDIGIVMFFAAGGARRRGDWAAVFTLFALYILLPAILAHVSEDLAALFRPGFNKTVWLTAASAWAQVVGVWAIALYRFLRDEERAQATFLAPKAVV